MGISQSRPIPPADLVFQNAKVWTVDSHLPAAEAVAIRGNCILAVGSLKELRQWIEPQTQVMDLGLRQAGLTRLQRRAHAFSDGRTGQRR
jgi:hypothetical protein